MYLAIFVAGFKSLTCRLRPPVPTPYTHIFVHVISVDAASVSGDKSDGQGGRDEGEASRPEGELEGAVGVVGTGVAAITFALKKCVVICCIPRL